jgi:hypothetical protein
MAVLGTALAVPGTAAASSGYTYKVIYNYCSNGDRANMKVKEIAQGYTPANYETIDMYAQEKYGGTWHQVHHFKQLRYSFNANGQTHTLTGWSWWENSAYYVRLKFVLRIWQGNYVLAHKTLYSVVC